MKPAVYLLMIFLVLAGCSSLNCNAKNFNYEVQNISLARLVVQFDNRGGEVNDFHEFIMRTSAQLTAKHGYKYFRFSPASRGGIGSISGTGLESSVMSYLLGNNTTRVYTLELYKVSDVTPVDAIDSSAY